MEQYVPPYFGEWDVCHNVFLTLCICWQVISGGWLRAYSSKLAKYVEEYPEARGVIYQCDVRTRNELAPKLRAQLQSQYCKDLVDGTAHRNPFDPNKPWGTVWQQIVEGHEESKWWFDHID